MKKLCTIIFAILAIICTVSCATTKYAPVQEHIIYTYKDSTILHRDTISIEIPKEIIREVVYADSSHLETSVASSTAIVDSCGFLHHSLENKPNTSLKKEIVYKDKIIYRDSIAVKEIPVEVEKEVPVQKYPKWHRFLIIYYIITMLYFTYKIGRKLKFF